ncbi:transporter substrate-binding domain-containing protein, partial [Streptomyces sp. NPDC006386]|uniref:transporter substrate-binding domain-containing protein n=1 Tax=Streptomyces sp. NPDC006386 TaxID=3156762 RepID=UPI0033A0A44A
MHPAPRALRRAAVAVALLAAAVSCAPQPEASSGKPSASATNACARGKLATETPGKLTVATDEPAYEPWFQDDDPANGKGFESAVAYAVAKQLGYGKGQVVWQTVPFNKAFAPGEKTFDFDINQVSISEERRKAVDFSSGYYDVRACRGRPPPRSPAPSGRG